MIHAAAAHAACVGVALGRPFYSRSKQESNRFFEIEYNRALFTPEGPIGVAGATPSSQQLISRPWRLASGGVSKCDSALRQGFGFE